MRDNSIKQFLMTNSFFVLNKALVKAFGIETAFFFSVLVEADDQLANEDGWFYQTVDTIENITGLSRHKQSVCIKNLISKGIIEQKNMGIPCKRHYRILYSQLSKILTTSYKKTNQLDSENLTNSIAKNSPTSTLKINDNKEHNINNINKELNINTKKEKKEKKTKQKFDPIEQLEETNLQEPTKEKIKEWLDYRKEKRNPIKTPRPINKMLKDLEKGIYKNEEHLIDSIDFCIGQEYTGLFPKNQPNNYKPKESNNGKITNANYTVTDKEKQAQEEFYKKILGGN